MNPQNQRLLARAAFAVLALFSCAPSLAAEKITLCFDEADVRPWHMANREGLNFELFNRVATRLDVTIVYEALPWKRCLAQVKANRIDGAMAVSFNAERADMGVFPAGSPPDINKRVHIDRYVLVRRKETNVHWDGAVFWKLEGPVGVQLGYSIADQLRASGVVVDAGSRKAMDLIRKLQAGRIGVAAMLELEAISLVRNDAAVEKQLEIMPIPLVEKPYFLMLARDFVATRQELATRINQAIEEVRNSAEYKKLERETLERTAR